MFLDTSGLLCYLHRDEAQHAAAVVAFDQASGKLIHNYIIAEFVALANARRLPRTAALNFAADLATHPDVEFVWVTPSLHRAGIEMLTKQQDKSYSLCDAISILTMQARHVTVALTTDRHFSQAGFRALLA